MVTAAKCDLGLVPIEQGSEAPSAVVNDSLIVWVAWKSQVFSLRAKKTSLLNFLNFFLFFFFFYFADTNDCSPHPW